MAMDDPGPPKSPESPGVLESADRLLAKYAAVWLWTVFFGINTGLSSNYLALYMQAAQFGLGRPGPRFPDYLGLVGPVAYGIGGLASAGAWIFLYLFFSVYLLPVVFLGTTGVSEERRRRGGARFLNRAYLLLLLAGVIRLAPEVLAFVAPLLTGF
ncbi:MAG TPA: hypothetical protein VF590_11705 [Isosphaeraceae bacterium]|jgi:hypothetical protein